MPCSILQYRFRIRAPSIRIRYPSTPSLPSPLPFLNVLVIAASHASHPHMSSATFTLRSVSAGLTHRIILLSVLVSTSCVAFISVAISFTTRFTSSPLHTTFAATGVYLCRVTFTHSPIAISVPIVSHVSLCILTSFSPVLPPCSAITALTFLSRRSFPPFSSSPILRHLVPSAARGMRTAVSLLSDFPPPAVALRSAVKMRIMAPPASSVTASSISVIILSAACASVPSNQVVAFSSSCRHTCCTASLTPVPLCTASFTPSSRATCSILANVVPSHPPVRVSLPFHLRACASILFHLPTRALASSLPPSPFPFFFFSIRSATSRAALVTVCVNMRCSSTQLVSSLSSSPPSSPSVCSVASSYFCSASFLYAASFATSSFAVLSGAYALPVACFGRCSPSCAATSPTVHSSVTAPWSFPHTPGSTPPPHTALSICVFTSQLSICVPLWWVAPSAVALMSHRLIRSAYFLSDCVCLAFPSSASLSSVSAFQSPPAAILTPSSFSIDNVSSSHASITSSSVSFRPRTGMYTPYITIRSPSAAVVARILTARPSMIVCASVAPSAFLSASTWMGSHHIITPAVMAFVSAFRTPVVYVISIPSSFRNSLMTSASAASFLASASIITIVRCFLNMVTSSHSLSE